MGIKEDVLRELVTEYQRERSPAVFARILKRVDRLLLKTIRSWAFTHPHLGNIGLQDLYHSAIVSLGKCLNTVRPQDSGGLILARIVAYVRNEMGLVYPSRRRAEVSTDDHFFSFCMCSTYDPFPVVQNRMVIEDVLSKCSKILTPRASKLLIKRFVKGKGLQEIANEEGCTIQAVSQRLEYWLRKIRKEARNGSAD